MTGTNLLSGTTLVRTSGAAERQAMMTQGLSNALCETMRINTTIIPCVWAVVTDTQRPCNAHPMFLSACVCWRRIRSHTPDLKHGKQLHVYHIIMSNASDWRIRTWHNVVKPMLLIAIRLIGKYVLELHSTAQAQSSRLPLHAHASYCNTQKHPIRVSAMIATKKGAMKKSPSPKRMPRLDGHHFEWWVAVHYW